MTRLETIGDPDDPRLAPFRDLRAPRAREADVVIEGAIAVERVLDSPWSVDAILATPSHAGRLAARRRAQVPIFVAEPAVIREVAGFDFHRGCLASAPRPPSDEAALEAWIEQRRARSTCTVVAALGLADPANLGALVRSARAFGVELVLCDRAGADPYSRRAIRASMGNVFCLPVLECDEPRAWAAHIRKRLDARTVAASLRPTAHRLGRTSWPARAVLMVGNEGEGLAPELLDAADLEVSIPIEPDADSLNVASATAILLHHAYTAHTVQNQR